MSEEASEQDKVIARVVLAGWQLVPNEAPAPHADRINRYQIISPDGTWHGSKPTRYTAALQAEMWIMKEELDAIFPV